MAIVRACIAIAAILWKFFQVGVLLGAENETRTREMMKSIIEFETEIAQVTTPSEDRRDDEKLYHAMNLTSLQSTVDMVSV